MVKGRASAKPSVIWGIRHVRQHTKIIVEGVILLHDDDDVLHVLQVTVSETGGRVEQAGCEAEEKNGKFLRRG